MTERFVLATANADKADEISAILEAAGLDAELASRPGDVPPVAETGVTLEDNARLKATALCAATGTPAIADDTGLEVDALDCAPGVESARFAGEDASYVDNYTKLIDALDGMPLESRGARFVTVAVARWPDGVDVAAIGSVEGVITDAPRGVQGFGYDPVFVPLEGDGRTFAEMSADEKHECSHRGEAFRTLALALRAIAEAEDR